MIWQGLLYFILQLDIIYSSVFRFFFVFLLIFLDLYIFFSIIRICIFSVRNFVDMDVSFYADAPRMRMRISNVSLGMTMDNTMSWIQDHVIHTRLEIKLKNYRIIQSTSYVCHFKDIHEYSSIHRWKPSLTKAEISFK